MATDVGQYVSKMGGFDPNKLQSKDDAKYNIGRVLSNFDPSKGIEQPGLLDALNGLGYGNFSGTGDNLQFSGETDKGRQAGLEGNYSGGDFISDYTGTDPNDHSGAEWQYGDRVADQSANAAQGSALAAALLNNAMANVPPPTTPTASTQTPPAGLAQQPQQVTGTNIPTTAPTMPTQANTAAKPTLDINSILAQITNQKGMQ